MHPLDRGAERGSFVDDKTGNQALGVIIGELVHFRRKGGIQGFVIGFTFPVGGNLLDDAFCVFRRNGCRRCLAGGQIAHRDIQKITVKLGIKDAITTVAAGAAKQKLVLLDADGNIFGNVHKSLAPAKHKWLAFRFFHGLGEIKSALDIYARFLAFKTLQQPEHTLMRMTESIFVTCNLVFDSFFLRRTAGAFCNCAHYQTSPV